MLQFLQSAVQVDPANVTQTLSQIDVVIQKLVDLSLSAGKHILMATIIYVVGRFLIKMVNRIVLGMLLRRHVEDSVRTFLHSLINIILTILLIISVIGALG